MYPSLENGAAWGPLRLTRLCLISSVRSRFACLAAARPDRGLPQDNANSDTMAGRMVAGTKTRIAFSNTGTTLNASWNCQILQYPEGLRLHSAERWRKGRLRPYLRRRA